MRRHCQYRGGGSGHMQRRVQSECNVGCSALRQSGHIPLLSCRPAPPQYQSIRRTNVIRFTIIKLWDVRINMINYAIDARSGDLSPGRTGRSAGDILAAKNSPGGALAFFSANRFMKMQGWLEATIPAGLVSASAHRLALQSLLTRVQR